MADIFAPYEVAESIIDETEIDEDEVYNERDGVTRAQLTLLSGASAKLGMITYTDKNGKKKSSTLKQNVYKTIHRLHASANKKNINFAANIKNTMYNTIQFAVMQQLEETTTPAQRKETMIIWEPSKADEQDPFHALNYGHTMSMQAAIDKGLGVRYGCQCTMRIISAPDEVEQTIDNANSI